MSIQQVSSSKLFGGYQKVFSHNSKVLACNMKFAAYLPPQCDNKHKVPVLYWLSGITCNEENFIKKSGGQRYAAEHGICIICPDTSPRNIDLPGQDDTSDFGSGAGFYIDATESPWNKHYKMYSYVTKELIKVVKENFPILPNQISISGHSMGGHGALICALKNPGLYRSVSALSPVCNPINTLLGQKALLGYLGSKETGAWHKWDATELIKEYNGPPVVILIDQGTEDDFYKRKELLPENLVDAASKNDLVQCILKMREGYDHSYYYVASVIAEHIEYHSKFFEISK